MSSLLTHPSPHALPHQAEAILPRAAHACRHCEAALEHVFVDLGGSPLCENYLTVEQCGEMEPFYPLAVYVCPQCLLVQLPTYVSGEQIFSEYAYFSSFSESYLRHAARYAGTLVERFGLSTESFVVELASNDGYLLRNFVKRGIACLGIEPAANVARAARERGVPTHVEFFSEACARKIVAEHGSADVIVANNVLAHVPDVNDFVRGMARLLATDGVAVVEVQHLLRLIERNQFDTIYHEHFCYYTLASLARVFAAQGLALFDVEEVDTHGGSIRAYFRHANGDAQSGVGTHQGADAPRSPVVEKLLAEERAANLHSLAGYDGFAERVMRCKRDLLAFLIEAKRAGKRVAGYGAPGKGNTLLNYCGIRGDLLEFTVDRNPYKHGKFLPGTHIPIYAPERLAKARPDYVLILPWNIQAEIVEQLAEIRDWGGQFVVPIPELQIIS